MNNLHNPDFYLERIREIEFFLENASIRTRYLQMVTDTYLLNIGIFEGLTGKKYEGLILEREQMFLQ